MSTPPAAHVAPGSSRARRIIQRIALGLAIVLFLTVAGGYAIYRHLAGNISHLDPNIVGPRPGKLTKAQNILLIGSDTRAFAGGAKFGSDVAGARSDTTILVHLSAGGKKAVLVSIPRDSYVEIPPCRLPNGTLSTPHYDKFNSAYAIGGPSCTIATVEHLTHIRIDHFVEVNFQGFQRMVNALGGVNICLSKPINDPHRYLDGHWIGSGLVLDAGTHTLKGAQALAFVRARYGVGDGSDIGRIKDQQLFISAVIRKATSVGLLVDLPALYGFLDAATKSIRTDPRFGLVQLKDLADRLHGLKPGKVVLLTVPILFNQPGIPAADVGWDPVKAPMLWDELRTDRNLPGSNAKPTPRPTVTGNPLTVPPSAITVQVLNATGRAGLAHQVAAELEAEGFHTVTGTATGTTATTVVRYGSNRTDSARTVVAAVKGAANLLDNNVPPNTLQLFIGTNFSGVVPVSVSTPTPTPTSTSTSTLNIVTADQDVCST